MATDIRFTNGTTTLTSVSAADFQVVDYPMQTPQFARVTVQHATRDGEDYVAQSFRDVNDKLTLVATTSISGLVRAINSMFRQAVRRQASPVEPKVYVEIKEHGSGTWWRSEILTGRQIPEGTFLDSALKESVVEFEIEFTRRFYWEKSTLTTLALTNINGSGVTTGLEVDNTTDAGRNNFVYFSNSTLEGDMPAPMLVQIAGTTVGTRTSDVWIGMGHRVAYAAYDPMVEGEDYSTGGSGASVQPGGYDTAYSDGYFGRFPTGTSGTEVFAFSWDLDDVFLSTAAGNWYRCLIRDMSASHSTEIFFRLTLTANGTILWDSGKIAHTSLREITDMGIVQLPPYYIEPGETAYDLVLNMWVHKPDGTSHNIDVDYLMFMPVDNWRFLKDVGYGYANTISLYDDSEAERTYTKGWSPTTAGVLNNYVARGPVLHVHPDVEGASSTARHYVYFVSIDENQDATPTRTNSVTLKYRPRRLLI